MLLAQPTIGFNYAGVLFPAMALLWARDRQIGTVAFVAGSLLVLVVPVGAAALVIALAIASWVRSPGSGLVRDNLSPRPVAAVRRSSERPKAAGTTGRRKPTIAINGVNAIGHSTGIASVTATGTIHRRFESPA